MKILMPAPKRNVRTYEMLGGGTISGSTPLELAVALRNSSYTPLGSLDEFITDVAKRCRTYDRSARVRTQPLAAFIDDLVKCGFLAAPQPKPTNVIDFPNDPDEEGEQ